MSFHRTTFATLALIFLVQDAFAQERRFGAWAVGLLNDKSGSYAATANESDVVFGQSCQVTGAGCSWFLIPRYECTVGGNYTVLVNSDAGTAAHTLSCATAEGKTHYRFNDSEQITSLVSKSSEIAFAFAKAGSQFQVSRFSLNGSNDALTLMLKTATIMGQKNNGSGMRDQVL